MDCEHPLFTVLTPWQLVTRAWLTVATIFQYRSVSFLSESFRRCNLDCPFFLELRFATFAGGLAAVIAQNSPNFMSALSRGMEAQSQEMWAGVHSLSCSHVLCCAPWMGGSVGPGLLQAGHFIQKESS